MARRIESLRRVEITAQFQSVDEEADSAEVVYADADGTVAGYAETGMGRRATVAAALRR